MLWQPGQNSSLTGWNFGATIPQAVAPGIALRPMINILAAALFALVGDAETSGTIEARRPPDNNVFFSLIRTESGKAPPIGWTRLPILPSRASVPRDGFFADAFFSDDTRQIVIAFRRLNPIPLVNEGTYDADAAILHGVAPRDYETDLHSFVQAVAVAAAEQTPPLSTAPDNIFVTGMSLGAYGAQLAAKEEHYGGVSFAGPGLPGYHSPPDRVANFVNYVMCGDPVANHAADTGISWAGWPSATSAGDHYGRIERLGNNDDQVVLQTSVTLAVASPINAPTGLVVRAAELTLAVAPPINAVAGLVIHAAGYFGLAVEIGLWHMSPKYKTMLHIETLPQR
jgi:hypothetical protein